MAEPIDDLESELASFRPQPVSLELRERIGAELAGRRSRVWMRVASLGGVAAAIGAIVGIGIWAQRAANWHANTPDIPRRFIDIQTVRPSTASIASPPTLMDYRRALGESTAAFDALLARPAGRGRSDAPAPTPMGPFNRSESNFTTDNGDSL